MASVSSAGVVLAHEGGVGGVAVALHGAAKVGGDGVFPGIGDAAGVPCEDGVATGPGTGPQVAEFGLPVAGREILDGRFVHLHVAAAEDAGADVFVNGTQPVGGECQPLSHRLARDVDVVPRGKYLLLTIERKMVAKLRDDECRDEAGCGDASLLQRVQRCDDGRGEWMIAACIFLPHDAAFEKTRRLVVELLGDFIADVPPSIRASLHRFGHDHFLHDGEMIGQARPAFTWRRWGLRAPWLLLRHGLRRFSRRIEPLQHQEQLRRVELLALRTEKSAQQRIHLFPQQFVFRTRLVELHDHARVFRRRADECFAQLFFA